jgi:hypothetical protein
MTNRLATAATWLARKQQAYLATTVTYRRGGSLLSSIAMTRGASGRQVDQLTGILSWFDQDWLVPATVLTIGPPKIGDRIEVGDSVYEVLPPDGEDCWRWSDQHETIYRIHTKRIEA